MDKTTKYSRQILLPGFGLAQQQKLFNAKVLVIGAGGLGCPTLLYLAASGIGNIGIVDFDVVEESNLHRQILYNQNDLHKPKVLVAYQKLKEQFTDTIFETHQLKIDNQNALEIIADYDIVVDGSDNFETRYLVNDACVLLNKPLVYGSIYQYQGQVSVFNLNQNNEQTANYRDLFPEPPNENEVPNCSEAGVIGVLAGIIGNMQANETIKIITGVGVPLINKLMVYNSLTNDSYSISISKNPLAQKLIPNSIQLYKKHSYQLVCKTNSSTEKSWQEVMSLIGSNSKTIIVDVREPNELPKLSNLNVLEIPLGELSNRTNELNNFSLIFTVCQSGVRSLKALKTLNQQLTNTNVFSIAGGVNSINQKTTNE